MEIMLKYMISCTYHFFQVLLPHGQRVRVLQPRGGQSGGNDQVQGFLNIFMYPSPTDIGTTDGECTQIEIIQKNSYRNTKRTTSS